MPTSNIVLHTYDFNKSLRFNGVACFSPTPYAQFWSISQYEQECVNYTQVSGQKGARNKQLNDADARQIDSSPNMIITSLGPSSRP